MFATPARDLEDKTCRGQHPREYIEDRLAIARDMRMIEPRTEGFAHRGTKNYLPVSSHFCSAA